MKFTDLGSLIETIAIIKHTFVFLLKLTLHNLFDQRFRVKNVKYLNFLKSTISIWIFVNFYTNRSWIEKWVVLLDNHRIIDVEFPNWITVWQGNGNVKNEL